jgi:hypothetical protein
MALIKAALFNRTALKQAAESSLSFYIAFYFVWNLLFTSSLFGLIGIIEGDGFPGRFILSFFEFVRVIIIHIIFLVVTGFTKFQALRNAVKIVSISTFLLPFYKLFLFFYPFPLAYLYFIYWIILTRYWLICTNENNSKNINRHIIIDFALTLVVAMIFLNIFRMLIN